MLTTANGEPLDEQYREHWRELATAAAGTILVLQKSDGKMTSIVLADYY